MDEEQRPAPLRLADDVDGVQVEALDKREDLGVAVQRRRGAPASKPSAQ